MLFNFLIISAVCCISLIVIISGTIYLMDYCDQPNCCNKKYKQIRKINKVIKTINKIII